MKPAIAILFAALAGAAIAGEAPEGAAGADAALDRGLAFVAKDSVAWKKEYGCASCHHGSLAVWSLREGKKAGRAIDEGVLAEMAKLIEAGDGTTSVPRPPDNPKGLNTKAVYFAMALGTNPEPDEEAKAALRRMCGTIAKDQLDNGSWSSWAETRPPIFGKSDDTATAMALIALLPLAESGDTTATAARDKGVKRMAETESDGDAQAMAMRLALWRRLGAEKEEAATLEAKIRARQDADGGWSQAEGMASDAWATGQALYALSFGPAAKGDAAIARGREFLARTQREDGSWAMTSRPIRPGEAGGGNLVPITGGGAAWGTIGLARTRPAAE